MVLAGLHAFEAKTSVAIVGESRQPRMLSATPSPRICSKAAYDIQTVRELPGYSDVRTTMICTHVFESWRPGSEEPGGQVVRKDAMRVMPKPYKTQRHRKDDFNQWTHNGLGGIARGVLSGDETRKRVCLETI
jgi:hypothetical protein